MAAIVDPGLAASHRGSTLNFCSALLTGYSRLAAGGVPVQGLLERETEFTAIAERLEAARSGEGSLLLVEAPAGMGKTELLAAARQRAAEAGMDILRARGGELEREFSFGVVRQLFEPPLARAKAAERKSLLAGAAALAAPVLGLAPPGRDGGAELPGQPALAAQHGLYWLAANLAERAPLLISVDDAHWADPSSLRFLIYLERRLEGLPLLVISAARPGEPGAELDLLQALGAEPTALTLRPEPLSEGAAARLVRETFSTDAEEEFCAACQEASGGNPFMLRELLGALERDAVPATAASAERVRGLGPETVSRSVLLRIARLPGGAEALGRAVAVLGAGAELRHAAALAELDEQAAAEAADGLSSTGILVPGRPLEFVHPIVRTVIYEELPRAGRALAHARAARLLAGEGARPEQVAAQLLEAEPAADRWVVELLREAAGEALARGAPDAAVTYLRRALEEPPATEVRADVLLALGSACFAAGDEQTVAAFEEALTLRGDADTRAAAAAELGKALWGTGQATEGMDLMRRAAGAVAERDRERALTLESELIALQELDPSSVFDARERTARLAGEIDGRTPAERLLLPAVGFERAQSGGAADEVARLAERALEGGLLAEQTADALPFYNAIWLLLCADRLEAAEHWLERALGEARARGSAFAFSQVSAFRAWLAMRGGAVADAEAEARGALEAARLQPGLPATPLALAFLVEALTERAEAAAAEEALEASGLTDVTAEHAFLFIPLQFSRGRLRLAQGRTQEGLDDLLGLGKIKRRFGFNDPFETPWASSAAPALAAAGDREQARRIVQEELQQAGHWGTPRGIGQALRALGLVEGGDKGVELLEKAAAALERCPSPLEQARALTDLGAALRRRKRRAEAREPLRRALDLAHRAGATALAKRAREELAATGAKPRKLLLTGIDALTASERRVVAMAAEGLTNKQIAQALFVTVKTVETHLGHAYQKLDISSRQDLPRALSAEAERHLGSDDQPAREPSRTPT
jgi:DNA-binding CsgD family transcriptional regulator